jgi:hypothetical protein
VPQSSGHGDGDTRAAAVDLLRRASLRLGPRASTFNDNSARSTTSAKEKGEVFEPLLGHPLRPFDQSFGRQWVGLCATVGTTLAGLMARIEFLAVGELPGKILSATPGFASGSDLRKRSRSAFSTPIANR